MAFRLRTPHLFLARSQPTVRPASDRLVGLSFVSLLMVALSGCAGTGKENTEELGEGTSTGDGDSGDSSQNSGGEVGDIDVGDIGAGGADNGNGEEGDPCDGPMPPASCELDYAPSGPGCGDGEINTADEECDDGNGLPGDGCSGLCKVEPNFNCDETGCTSSIVCGDGTTQAGEVCDDGNTEAGDGCGSECLLIETDYLCPPDGGACEEIDECQTLSPPARCFPAPGSLPYCGNGTVDPERPSEECDDGNALPGDGCTGSCQVEPNWDCSSEPCIFTIVCGNGEVEAGEVCDDNNTTSGDGCQSDCLSLTPGYSCPPTGGACSVTDPCDSPAPPASCNAGGGGGGGPQPYCGDGSVNQVGEACDDGNAQPGDGCSGACQVEPNWDCITGTCISTIVCGDGDREGDEICDDGNLSSGDGCSDACQTIDPYYSCPPTGGTCTSTVSCNDGRITGNEECEDGNVANGDGCSSSCMLETGYFCPTVGDACSLVPYCGDGNQTAGEQCDDGGSAAPGCDANCQIEDGYACPNAGQNCVAVAEACGNGDIEAGEQCDDDNVVPGDGCSTNCQLETGFVCAIPGEECVPECGDELVVEGQEACDDGNLVNGDGCSASCELESGFSCDDAQPTHCETDTCGNGIIGNDEACDGDTADVQCAPDCTIEPNCDGYGVEGCTSACGDGLIINEACDDGNLADGDGCSSECEIEPGFTCSQNTECGEYADWDHDDDGDPNDLVKTCVSRIPVTYRDFSSSHSDMQPGENSVVNEGLVADMLDAEGKPVFIGANGQCQSNQPCIASAASFRQWYRDVSGVNTPVIGELVLWDRDRDPDAGTYNPDAADVTFVNRYGSEGQQWGAGDSGSAYMWCGNKWGGLGSNAAGSCAMNGSGGYNNPLCRETDPAFVRCVAVDGSEAPPAGNEVAFGNAAVTTWYSEYLTGGGAQDGNPAFFPINHIGNEFHGADIPGVYGGGTVEGTQNFHFTSEVRRWFKYEAGRSYQLDFTGDDDVWVFINGRLAVDIGSYHETANASFTINANGSIDIVEDRWNGGSHVSTPSTSNISNFNMQDEGVYEIVVFQAERKYTASSYRLTLGGFNTNPSSCEPVCGDGITVGKEECDDGVNDGGYGECQEGCLLGTFCGDGTPQGGEECDNGRNLSSWNDRSSGACAPGCVIPGYCGDGNVDAGSETCDEGVNNSADAYNGCSDLCTFGPYCGDGQRQAAHGEECDDGVNDGTAGCGPDCKSTISCGNGQIDPGEQCDDGVNDGGYGECAIGCIEGPYCGDATVNATYGETCDDGTNDGTYGGCSPVCQMGPFCGDSLVNGNEDCDDGVNDGGYGECGLGCNTGTYCGDGEVDGPEECDDGTNDGTITACQAGCTWGPYCGDGNIDAAEGEVCDNGENLGGYNQCGPTCQPGPYCGDGIPQLAQGELCDDGDNDGGYGECAENCRPGPFCGDGIINGTETCDDAVNNGAYGRCAPDCTTGSYCGDGVKQAEEECDDGTNDGEVSSCLPGCVFGPGCGDGILQEGETCDLGALNSTAYNGCLPNSCIWGPSCGDGIVQSAYEQCDDGVNPGGYGECAQNCRIGPYCGDGVVNGDEICDDGVNDGGYGECAPACKLGPYCGDGTKDPEERCDDGNRTNGDGCSASCYSEVITR